MSADAPAIRTEKLRKVYPAPGGRKVRGGRGATGTPLAASIVALDALDLEIRPGEFFGLLGPNGAGKTTTIAILTTRARPTSGTATVAGADVSREGVTVRQRIGVVPQRPNPDRALDVRDNLLFHASYFGMPKARAVARTSALMEQLGIADKGDAKPDELSGGQGQRLMIARALLHEPAVIFLDEPTVGLDPQARLALWDILRGLHAEGRTIVMTTHYMQEAETLCDRLAIVDQGKLLAVDSPDALKARAPGGTQIELALDGDAALAAERAGAVPGVTRVTASGAVLRAYSERGGMLIPALIEVAEGAGRVVQDIHLAPPSLETLFVSITGRKLD